MKNKLIKILALIAALASLVLLTVACNESTDANDASDGQSESDKSTEKAEAEVLEAYGKMKNGIVILERFVPWSDTLAETDAVFVIYPSLRGGYNLQGIPVSADSRDVKKTIPEAWRGRSAQELAHISGIKGLNFCHAGGFLAAADSLEDAFKTAELILSMEGFA